MRDEDVPECQRILRACFVPPVAESYCLAIAMKDGKVTDYVVAEYMGLVVGLMLFELRQDEVYGACLAVCPHFQGGGVGRLMAEWLIAKLPEFGSPSLTLHVHENDQIPQRLYKSLGFKHVATIPNVYPDGGAALAMRLDVP